MTEIVLILGLAIGVTTFLFQLIARYATQIIARSVESRMRDTEVIVNEESIPHAWIASYHARQAALIAKNAGLDELAKLGQKTQSECIKKIDDLLHFYENNPIADSEESRIVLRKALQKTKAAWQNASWEYFLQTTHHGSGRENAAIQSMDSSGS